LVQENSPPEWMGCFCPVYLYIHVENVDYIGHLL